jgi:hypothetical protein
MWRKRQAQASDQQSWRALGTDSALWKGIEKNSGNVKTALGSGTTSGIVTGLKFTNPSESDLNLGDSNRIVYVSDPHKSNLDTATKTQTTPGTLTGNGFTGANFIHPDDGGIDSETLIVVVDGTSASYTIEYDCTTRSQSVTRLNGYLSAVATVTQVDGVLVITSKSTGTSSSVSITTVGSGANALALFGTLPVSDTGTETYPVYVDNGKDLVFNVSNFLTWGVQPTPPEIRYTVINGGSGYKVGETLFLDANRISSVAAPSNITVTVTSVTDTKIPPGRF